MANARKSLDGRKRARTMEYIDSQVDINDEDPAEANVHIGQRIEAAFDLPTSMIDEVQSGESSVEPVTPSVSNLRKRTTSERFSFPRQMSDVSFSHATADLNKTTTELRGRDHILRLMKTNTSKPVMEIKGPKFVQEMIARRHEKHEASKPMVEFAMRYGLVDNNGKTSKSRKTSEPILDMTQQLESLQPSLKRRQIVDVNSPLLRITKLESVYNRLLCYCQYVSDQADVVLFLDPSNEQTKGLAINDEIRIAGESRIEMNLPELGSTVALGISDVRRESTSAHNLHAHPEQTAQTYEFLCSCDKCMNDDSANRALAPTTFDLRTTFPHQQAQRPVEPIFDSFTLALMTQRKFDLRVTIIIHNHDQLHHVHIFIVRDGVGNCLEIRLTHIDGFPIELQSRQYVFHQIEYAERIESPKEARRWPYEQYAAPKKLFSFTSTANQVSLL